jgi:hypothetical protein
MSWGRAERLEAGADGLAAAALTLAVAFTATNMAPGLVAAAASALVGCTAYLGLRNIMPEPETFRIAEFVIQPFKPEPCEELLLTEADRFDPRIPGRHAEPAELLLDDVLARLGPESRVVRLFDPSAMPSAGELQYRIDRHVRKDGLLSALPDASQALYEALSELRRSLN